MDLTLAQHRTCAYCGQPRPSRRGRYCSDLCFYLADRTNPHVCRLTCEICAARLPAKAKRGKDRLYCSNACKVAARLRKYVPVPPRPRRQRRCVVCGDLFDAAGKRKTCSDACHVSSLGSNRPPASRTCPVCGESFETRSRNPQLYCSKRCSWVAENARRGRGGHRTRHTGAQRERYDDAYVFERDRWHCHICRRRIRKNLKWPHPWSASIDHLIPCGRRDQGPDTLDNVRAAHLRCNLSKGRRAANDQLMLVG